MISGECWHAVVLIGIFIKVPLFSSLFDSYDHRSTHKIFCDLQVHTRSPSNPIRYHGRSLRGERFDVTPSYWGQRRKTIHSTNESGRRTQTYIECIRLTLFLRLPKDWQRGIDYSDNEAKDCGVFVHRIHFLFNGISDGGVLNLLQTCAINVPTANLADISKTRLRTSQKTEGEIERQPYREETRHGRCTGDIQCTPHDDSN